MSDEPSCSNDLDPQLPRCAWLLACSVSRKDASPQSSASARRIPGRILSGNGVHRFRNHCSTSPEYAQKSDAISYLERISKKHPLADVLLISPPNGSGGESPFTLRNQERVVGKDQPDGTSWRLNKDRVASRGDEGLGLDDLCDEAKKIAKGEDGCGAVSDTHYRMVRNRPLLMIHSLEPKGDNVVGPIAAFGISFPYGDYSTTINVVVNKVWLKQMVGYADDPAEEEDQYD